ncbi:Uncharacterised protein [Orientia tsutsugamushi]|uniref:Uncharacterized protein n=1 Tax=Orientia tsutsugamushi TaxID=784 RepID=A0A2U3RTX8_ORITS|nr:hypothetical protein OTSKARP_0089 [Orientia tsutsugamushi str. Karp]SPR16692.1 Uncharacterised protein [Orientia tsutsugamushi]
MIPKYHVQFLCEGDNGNIFFCKTFNVKKAIKLEDFLFN